jgi:hypothetical protein
VWNHAVLGDWRKLPYAEYSAQTFPFDMPTWNTDWSPPPREIPPDLEALADVQRVPFEQRTLASLPGAFLDRADQLGRAALPTTLSWLRFLVPVGLFLAGAAGAVAFASVLLLLLAHLTMPHPPDWTIYYLDVFPVVTFAVVIALGAIAARVYRAMRAAAVALAPAHGLGVALVSGLVLIAAGATSWRPPRIDEHAWMQREKMFRAGVCALPAGKKMVFVKSEPGASPHHNLIDNDPRWGRSDTWIVREWDTARHRALMDAAPDRAAYFYDEKARWFARMNRDGMPTREGVVNVLGMDTSRGAGLRCRDE